MSYDGSSYMESCPREGLHGGECRVEGEKCKSVLGKLCGGSPSWFLESPPKVRAGTITMGVESTVGGFINVSSETDSVPTVGVDEGGSSIQGTFEYILVEWATGFSNFSGTRDCI